MSNYNDPNTLDFLNDDEGLIMASMCMAVVVHDLAEEVHETLDIESAWAMRDFTKSIAYLGQVIDEDLSASDPLDATGSHCWEALGCDDFSVEYQYMVLSFFLGAGLEHAQAIAANPGDTVILFQAGEALRESFLEEIENFLDVSYALDEYEPTEAQEWADFDPDC